jgi:hypothetical protein
MLWWNIIIPKSVVQGDLEKRKMKQKKWELNLSCSFITDDMIAWNLMIIKLTKPVEAIYATSY